MSDPGFRSYVWGGFEGASHRRADGQRIDSVATSGHERWARLHLATLRSMGVETVRESLRWHLIETTPGRYDWSSAQRQIDAACAACVSVAWGLCHWGLPDHVDPMAPCWPSRFADFAFAAAEHLRASGSSVAAWVPINEIAFWARYGGDTGTFAPYLRGSGDRFKQSLVSAHLAGVDALRSAGATQPIMLCEPLISVMPADDDPETARAATSLVEASFAAVHQIRAANPRAVDVLGLNFYGHNQWRTDDERLDPGEIGYRPLRMLLRDVRSRFPGLRLALSETGAEEPYGRAWLGHISGEIAAARAGGLELEGVCIYPVHDYSGWDNGRHCPCGPLGSRNGLPFVRHGQRAAMAKLAAAGGRPMGLAGFQA